MENQHLEDLVEQWHLTYEGPLELVEFIMSEEDMSRSEVEAWLYPFQTRNDEGQVL